jgi:hypothetical protein
VRRVPDEFVLARVLAFIALFAIVLLGVLILGAIALRFAGRRPGRRWGVAFAFLFGVQAGVVLIFTGSDFVQRAGLLALLGLAVLWLLWRDRRVLAGALIAGCAGIWAALWGYYVLLLVTRTADFEPFVTWTFFLAGAALTAVGLGLMAAGDPLPAEPSATAPSGQPGSRQIGIVARTVLAPESIGPIPISEIASFATVVVTVLAVGLIGIPFPLEPVVQIVLAALAGNAARIVARPARARRAYEAFSWLAEWEVQRARELTGLGPPMTKGGVASWLQQIPATPDTAWLRVEGLAWLEHFEEAREVIATMPVATSYERFEQRYAMDYIDWMSGGAGDPDGLRAAAEQIDPVDEDSRLRAMVAIALRESARIAADRGPEEALEPLLLARDQLGARADGQLVRALWRRNLPISLVTAAVITLLTLTPG